MAGECRRLINRQYLRRATVLLAALALASLTACASTHSAMQVVATTPGALLSVQEQAVGAALPHASQRYLLAYRSRGVNGELLVASGFALLPKGTPPKNGWPVLAWAHGTTGVADICAPSAIYPGGPEDGYHQLVLPVLDWWLAQGYAVIAPDYQGLGTPGGHPYMDATSQLHSVDDAVLALHQLRPNAISPDWLVMGHSQGGAAALEVAAHGQADAPSLNLRGAIAIAPGGYRYADIATYVLSQPQLDPGVAAFLPIVLLGAEAADPSLKVDQLVSADMQPLMDLARSRCLSGLRKEVTESPASIFKKDADLKPLLSYLKQQSIEQMTPTVPVMFIQGADDKLVSAQGTHAYYRQLCKAGKTVFYHPVANGSHRDALTQSPPVSKAFIAYLNGQGTLPACTATSK